MIHFPTLRTQRFDCDLRELSIAEECQLLAMPEGRHEQAAGALLKLAIKECRGSVTDPRRWTVQERMLAVAHYMACTSAEDGNFLLGDTEDSGRFLDYLIPEKDAVVVEVAAGQALGSDWKIRQLIGAEAEVMDGLCQGRLQWLAADISARMHAGDDPAPPDAVTSAHAYSEWLRERIANTESLPASDFAQLFACYSAALPNLQHLFRLGFDGLGHVVLPRDEEGRRASMAPARFPVDSAVTDLSRALCG